ncbi:uracil-DNA glycosylase [Sphingomonas sp. Leaf343]|uniref:uracil-DNA glycosylase n=1 Tax=Sphingomonas sp. Leaf343 TaxID=1736345 RepID=UPI0006F5843B|nr:uracil-DNA glycosylase [Sphingomonas sp. Leaf343]KQR83693.1 uracil-DNA glycosylase [Sphingomonas sp. Leaf343]
MNPRIDPSWEGPLVDALACPDMAALHAFLDGEAAAGKQVFPAAADRFRALELTPLPKVRVVILGQDPYHGPGQAHGLSFSVRPGIRPPPSLVNIYKELHADLGIAPARHGFLEHWAKAGVLLLNTVMSVEAGRAGSHRDRGWERFTDAVIRAIAAKPEPVVFLLWGAHAQKKAAFVRTVERGGAHLVLSAPHPSPLSAYKGWFGSRPFSQANAFLVERGAAPVDWALPNLPRIDP